MCEMSTPDPIHSHPDIVDFYTKHLNEFGNSSKGMGWKDDHAQLIRFVQLARVISQKEKFSINDLGCGTGRFYHFLSEQGYASYQYYGYDMLDEMIDIAKRNLLPNISVSLKKITASENMTEADYTIASGVFNVKYDSDDTDWLNYIKHTLEDMNSKSKKGFAFNLLTAYSDKEFMQSYLYYADPLFFFDFCKRNFSKNVALLHDYFQYDFTILVRKDV